MTKFINLEIASAGPTYEIAALRTDAKVSSIIVRSAKLRMVLVSPKMFLRSECTREGCERVSDSK